MTNLTRIKNNQITDNTIIASTKVVPYTVTGGLLENNMTYGSNLFVSGNLTISGTTTTVDTTNTLVADPLIVLNRGATGSNTVDIGIVMERGSDVNVAMIYDEANDQFAFISTTEVGTTAGAINNSGYSPLKVGNLFAANASITSAITAPEWNNGNSNIRIASNGNVSLSATGASNVVVITSTGANISGTANVTGNLDAGNIATSGVLSVTGNANTGNLGTNIAVVTTGNITTINSGLLQNGTSNVRLDSSGNVTTSVGGTSNVLIVTSTGANISGTANVTGNLDAGNIATSGVLSVTGNANTGNLGTNTAVVTTGNITTINSGLMQNGNSNVAIAANGNITLTSTSNATLVITGTGANITGTANVTGNLDAGNVIAAGNVNGGNVNATSAVVASTLESNVSTGTAPIKVVSTTQVANLNVAVAGSLIDGTSNVEVATNGNVTVSVGGNANVLTITGTGANITGTANVTGNINAGNVNVSGNVNAAYYIGNGSQLTGIVTTSIENGNSNVIVDANANIRLSSTGNANVVVVTGAGANITGYANVSGNIDAANVNAGNLTTSGDIAVNGGDITTSSTTFNIVTANATTVNFGNAATTLNIGSSSGEVVVAGELKVAGNDIKSSTGNVAITLDDIDVTIAGNLTVQGKQTTVGTDDLVVQDSLVRLHTTANLAPLTVDDGRDIGIVMHYYKVSNKEAGLVWANDTGKLEYYSDATETISGTFTGTYGGIKAATYESTQTTGTAPFIVNSTTQVANLNVAVAGSLVNGNSNVIVDANANVRISAIGNANVLVVSGTGANITGTANVSGNLDAGNIASGGTLSVTGNANTGNLGTNTAVITTGNITTINSGLLQNGTSNLRLDSSGNVTTSVGGNSNVFTVTSTGANISGTANVTGNLDAGNIATSGVLSVTGNANTGNLGTNTAVVTTGNITTINSGLMQNGNSNIVITANANVTITATSNATLVITGTGANITGTANISGNANVGNLGTEIVSATGNITGANINTAGKVVASTLESNVATGTAPLTVVSTTQVANLNVAVAGSLVNGNSNVVVVANANVNISSNGNANVFVVTGTGANVTGTFDVTGNSNVGNLGTSGLITASGNVSGGNLTTVGVVSAPEMSNGNSNVRIAANSNIAFSMIGNSNVVVFTGTGANIAGTLNVTGNSNISNVSIYDANITSTGSNANLNIDANGTGSVVLNAAGDNSNVIINGNTAGGYANLIYADATSGQVGIRTAPSANVALHIGTTTAAIMPKGTTGERPSPATSGMLRYNTSDNKYEFYDGGTWDQFGTAITLAVADTYTGDGSTLAFVLSKDSTTAATIVAINGVVQQPTTAYTVSGNVLTFTEAPISTDVIDTRALVTTTAVTHIGDMNSDITVSDSAEKANVTINGNLIFSVGNAAILPGADNTYNIGSGSLRWKNVYATNTTIQAADLAEYYVADADYEPGTVVDFGGTNEVTICNSSMSQRIAGVVSTEPGYVMNDGQAGEFTLPVALQGRVPTKVTGTVRKGDMMVSAGNGHAMSCSAPVIGSVIGKALADFDGTDGIIEVVIGRV